MPMVKTSTLFYFLDNRESQHDLLIETDRFIDDSFKEFDDVLTFLDNIEFEPSSESIESILDYSR